MTYFFNVKTDALFLPTDRASDTYDRYEKQLKLVDRELKNDIHRIVLRHNFSVAPPIWPLLWAFPNLEEIILLNHNKIMSGQAIDLEDLEIDENAVFGWQGNNTITEVFQKAFNAVIVIDDSSSESGQVSFSN